MTRLTVSRGCSLSLNCAVGMASLTIADLRDKVLLSWNLVDSPTGFLIGLDFTRYARGFGVNRNLLPTQFAIVLGSFAFCLLHCFCVIIIWWTQVYHFGFWYPLGG